MRLQNLLVMIFVMAIATPMIVAQELPVEHVDDISEYETVTPLELESPIALEPCECNSCRNCGAGAAGSFKCRQQQKWWGFPEEFNELPLGSTTNSIFQTQFMLGEKARLTLYDYDFISGAPALKARGLVRLSQLTNLVQRSGGTITIQAVQSDLDAQRLTIVQYLVAETLGPQSQQIVVATPNAVGLKGEESIVIRQNQLKHASEYGVRAFSTGSFSTKQGSSGSAR